MPEIEFSGERVVPGKVEPALWIEHLARYTLAARLAHGKRILDHGCGTGYGAGVLVNGGATAVLGLDRSLAAVAHARQTLPRPRFRLLVGDCLATPLRAGSFDLIVAFEVLEHLEPTSLFLDEIHRLLAPEGLLLLSTPNRTAYREARRGESNPFHVREFDRRELLQALRQRFPTVRLIGQWTTEGSLFLPLERTAPDEGGAWILGESAADVAGPEQVDYFLAICSPARRRLPNVPPAFHAADTNQLRSAHRRIAQLQDEVEERTSWARTLDRQIGEHRRTAALLRARIAHLEHGLARHDERAPFVPGEAPTRWLEVVHRRLLQMSTDSDAATPAKWGESHGAARRDWNEVVKKRAANYLGRAAKPARLAPPVDPPSVRAGATAKRESPAPTPDGRPRQVLFVQSGSVELACAAMRALIERLFANVSLTLVTHHSAAIPDSKILPSEVSALVAPSWRALIRHRWSLRRQRFDAVIVLWTNELGYRRLKLFALTFTLRGLFVFNENADAFQLGPAKVARHVLWRYHARRGLLSKARTALRVIRNDGWRALCRHLRNELRRVSQGRASRRLKTRFRPSPRLGAFPASPRPLLSIVIPVHDQWRCTHDCLVSILGTVKGVEYEVLVVDDGSTDETPRMLARQRHIRTIRLDTNQGFVEACNRGAAVARGEYLLFLNNDTRLMPGCVQAMLATFKERPDCGVVGPKILYPDGLLQEAGGIVWRDGTAWNCGKFGDPAAPEYNYLREVDYVSGAALMVPRGLFDQLGGFDRRYSPGYWEDTDLCFAARSLGRRVYFQPRAELVHLEGATAGRSTKTGMKRFQTLHQQIFRSRWEDALAGQVPCDPELVFIARDRCRARVVLVIDHHVPTWDKDAGSYVLYRVLGALRRLGYRVVFWPDNLYALPRYTEHLQQQGIEVLYGALDFGSFIEQRAAFFDLAVIHRSSMADRYLPRLMGKIPEIVYICADLEHLREQRRVAALGTPGVASSDRVEELWRRELGILRRADRVAVHSPAERALLAARVPEKPVAVLPLPVRLDALDGASFAARRDLLFVGSAHPPNTDAVEFWREAIAPLMEQVLPGVTLDVVGEASRALAWRPYRSAPVRLHGYVPDATTFYASRRVFVAPLRYGAGVKGKVLEAMSSGIPVVTTSIGAEGIELESGVNAFVADTPEAFVEAIRALYGDHELWERVRRRARETIEHHYSDSAFQSAVERLVG